MMSATFLPMDLLDHEDDVEFLLINDTVVLGRMLKGGINGPSTRSYWTRDGKGKIAFIRPVGWRYAPGGRLAERESPGATQNPPGATKELAA